MKVIMQCLIDVLYIYIYKNVFTFFYKYQEGESILKYYTLAINYSRYTKMKYLYSYL